MGSRRPRIDAVAVAAVAATAAQTTEQSATATAMSPGGPRVQQYFK